MKTKKWEGFSGKGKYNYVKVDEYIVFDSFICLGIDREIFKVSFGWVPGEWAAFPCFVFIDIDRFL